MNLEAIVAAPSPSTSPPLMGRGCRRQERDRLLVRMRCQSRWLLSQVPSLTAALGLILALLPGLLAAEPCTARNPGGFKYFVGIVGNPSVPDISWSDEELAQIKTLGVNMVQLSIAWGGRPANEVINLEDLDPEQRAKFAFRIKQAHKHGLRTIAQFGIPRVLNASPVRPACILDPKLPDKLIREHV